MGKDDFPNFRTLDVPIVNDMKGVYDEMDDVIEDTKNYLDTTIPILVRVENGKVYDVKSDPKSLLKKKESVLEKALKLLGGCCQWPGCVIDDLDMMKIDHKYNDGSGLKGSIASKVLLFKRTGFDPTKRFQALCENHKNKKLIENKRRRSIGLDVITCVENGSVSVV